MLPRSPVRTADDSTERPRVARDLPQKRRASRPLGRGMLAEPMRSPVLRGLRRDLPFSAPSHDGEIVRNLTP